MLTTLFYPREESTGGTYFPSIPYRSHADVKRSRKEYGIELDPEEIVEKVEQALEALPAVLPKRTKTITLAQLIGKEAAAQVDTTDHIEIAFAAQRENKLRKRRKEDEFLLLMD